MKKLFILLLMSSLYLTACGPSSQGGDHGHEHTEGSGSHEEGDHSHENGDHSHPEGDEHHEQESFDADGQDSTDTTATGHSHENGEADHQH